MERPLCAGGWAGVAGRVCPHCVHSRPAQLRSPRCVGAESGSTVLLDVAACQLRDPTQDYAPADLQRLRQG